MPETPGNYVRLACHSGDCHPLPLHLFGAGCDMTGVGSCCVGDAVPCASVLAGSSGGRSLWKGGTIKLKSLDLENLKRYLFVVRCNKSHSDRHWDSSRFWDRLLGQHHFLPLVPQHTERSSSHPEQPRSKPRDATGVLCPLKNCLYGLRTWHFNQMIFAEKMGKRLSQNSDEISPN